ncbi:MAG: hypothetical protein R3C14_00480 [Caldilineaceae bacterium]
MDFLLQDHTGTVVGIAVKAASAVQEQDFKGLRALAALTGARFVRGCIFYTGDTLLPFGENMYAVPMAGLWNTL